VKAGAESGPAAPRWSPRLIASLGALFLVAMLGQAGYDIYRQYGATTRNAQKELEAQARVIAEQTARSVQAMDLVLRHIAEQFRHGALGNASRDELHRFLKGQSIGLVQADGLAFFDAGGAVAAASNVPVGQLPRADFANDPFFTALRDDPSAGLHIGQPRPSPGNGRWIFPLGRRVDLGDGRFAGVIGAAGRTEYFQAFYRETFPDASTRISLLHRNGVLLVRHPSADGLLGRRLDVIDEVLPPSGGSSGAVARLPSPVDGVDHFVALRAVPDHPLVVAVSRDASAVLAPWRAQSLATALRTTLLGCFAGGLLWAALRLLARAQAGRAALEASEQRYALAMTGTGEGHWLWDMGTRQVYVSDKLAELFQLPGGAGLLRDDDYFDSLPLHPEDRERVHRNRADHVAGRTPRLDHEFRIVRRDTGEVRWIHTRAQCFRDARGAPLKLAGSTIDITERKRAEDSLRQSEERYMLAMAGLQGGHWVFDSRTDTVFVSPALNAMFGRPAQATTLPRAEHFARMPIHPDDVAQVGSLIERQIAGQLTDADYECRILTSDGERWTRTRTRRFGDESDDLRIAGVTTDITEHKRSELARQRLEEQLRQAQKLEAIGTLAGGIAHDFNNILSAILGYGELALRHAEPGSALQRHVEASISAGQRAKSLVERILAFSRSGVGERVPVHVPSVVDEALDAVAGSLPAGITLQRDIVRADVGVRGDPTQIHQVVMNLCANAVHAMRQGGALAVSLSAIHLPESRAVSTSTLAAGPYLRLDVRDSGDGIAPALLQRIFDPFFTTREVGVGTGLGLSLVHGIVTDLGGGIDVASEPGRGSLFSVYFPALEGVRPAATGSLATVPPGQGQVVLLVDDEEALVRLGEEQLAELGYEPVGFSSAAAALDVLRADPGGFDLLLSDEAMPGMTGSELVQAARRIRPDLPVVLMSGFVTPGLLERAKALGIDGVLNKPLASPDIAVALADALRRHRGPPGPLRPAVD
jgi:PAS domain S-box-containing protein